MCGICGEIKLGSPKPVDKKNISSMMANLTHRGPDASGSYADENVALGHTRLSIIDLAGGRQPIFNEDHSVCVICNGEIYNYKELRQQLNDKHQFSTNSDTEVIVHLWEQYGEKCVEYLNGMFAFAIYDMKQNIVFMARDRFGQKPLHYAENKGSIYFCSEIYPLAQIPEIDTSLNPYALDEFFTHHYIPAPATIYNGIKKLLPAHTLTVSRGGVKTSKYWSLQPGVHTQDSFERATNRVDELLRESLKYRMRSDVPVGAFLSGGVDSSLLTALITESTSNYNLQTFCIGFDEKKYDERMYASQVAANYGTQHFDFKVEPDVLELMPNLVKHYGEPYGDSSAIPTWYVCQKASEKVKVVISGDGGDEIFAGYNRLDGSHLAQKINSLNKVLGGGFIKRGTKLIPHLKWNEGVTSKFKIFMENSLLPPVERYINRESGFSPILKSELYSKKFKEQLQSYDNLAPLKVAYESLLMLKDVEKQQYIDLQHWLPGDILTKVDIASMANSLEVRSPFLDHNLAEYVMGLPFEYRYKLFNRKRILREVSYKYFKKGFINRKKSGFRIPLGHWFRTSLKSNLRRALHESPIFTNSEYFNEPAIQKIFNEHQEGKIDHTHRLWDLWFLGEWSKTLMSGISI